MLTRAQSPPEAAGSVRDGSVRLHQMCLCSGFSSVEAPQSSLALSEDQGFSFGHFWSTHHQPSNAPRNNQLRGYSQGAGRWGISWSSLHRGSTTLCITVSVQDWHKAAFFKGKVINHRRDSGYNALSQGAIINLDLHPASRVLLASTTALHPFTSVLHTPTKKIQNYD